MSASIPLVYIAGPLGGATPEHVASNIAQAASYREPIALAGGCPVCPHTMTQGLYGADVDERFWLDAMLALLARCDALLLTPGWETSAGARAEHARTLTRHVPAFEARDPGALPTPLLEWLRQWREAHA